VRDIHESLGELVGQTRPGGCDDCDAVQTVERDPDLPGLYHLQVQHDDSCPTYRRLKRKGLAR